MKHLLRFRQCELRCWHYLERKAFPILAILIFLTCLFSVIGVSLCNHDGESWFNTVSDVFYETGQIISLNMSPHNEAGQFNWAIGWARLFAVTFVAFVGLGGIRYFLKKPERRFWMNRLKGRHTLICGLGRIGYEVARQSNGRTLAVALEKQDANYWTRRIEDEGAIVFQENASDLECLREYVLADPATIYLTMGDDHTNLTALANIRRIRSEHNSKPRTTPLNEVTCFVHLEDAALEDAVSRTMLQMNFNTVENMNVRPFNIFHETATQLIIDKLTPLRPRERDEVALYVVVGFGQMGKAMVRELAEFAHFENQKRSRILVLCPDASAACNSYLKQWGQLSPRLCAESLEFVEFDPECDEWACRRLRPVERHYQADDETAVEYVANVQFVEMPETSLSIADTSELVRLAMTDNVCPVVMFCCDEDETNFRLATEFNSMLQQFHFVNLPKPDSRQIPLFVFLPSSRTLREMLNESDLHASVDTFGNVAEGLRRAQDNSIEPIGIAISWDYDKGMDEFKDMDIEQYARSGWLKKQHWEWVSNMQAAEHALIKVQMLGYRMLHPEPIDDTSRSNAPLPAALDPPHDQRALLAIVEHNRWMAERFMMGWKFGERCNHPPQRTSFQPKRFLEGTELDKDYAQIRAIFEHFRKRGHRFEPLSKRDTPNP